jgi:hypothetical protein
VVTRRCISRTADIVELNQITLRVYSTKDVAATANLVRDLLHVPDPANSNDPGYTSAAISTDVSAQFRTPDSGLVLSAKRSTGVPNASSMHK